MANLCTVTLYIRGFKSLSDGLECTEILLKEEKKNPLYDPVAELNPAENKITASGWTRHNATGVLLKAYDLAEHFGVVIEILGTEPGCEIGEHYVVNANGELVVCEYFDYQEFYTDAFENYADFVSQVGPIVTEAEFKDLDFFSRGNPDTEFGEYIDNLTFPAL